MNQQITEGEQPKINPGALLKQARMQAEFSAIQVSARMNLSVHIIESIDADDYDENISPAFYRGYLRAYAQLVAIDADEVVEFYNNRIHKDSLSANITPTFDTNLYTKKDHHYPYFKWFIYFLSTLFVVFAGYYLWTKLWTKKIQSNQQQTEIQLNTQATQDSANIPLTGLNHSSDDNFEESSGDNQQNRTSNNLNSTGANTEKASTKMEQSGLVESPMKKSDSAASIYLESAVLEMTFNGDCWVKVVDAGGEVLALGIKRSGKTMSLSGMAPFKVILGNAAVVSIEYNQQEVDLTGYNAGSRVELEISATSELLQ